MDEQGDIYARGAQDTKALGIQYLEAIRRLKLNGQRISRTVHVSFVPDEEIGGELGMKEYVRSEHFESLNVGFALDEGTGYTDSTFFVSNDEKTKLCFKIKCEGISGHGSSLMDNTAGEKMRVIIDRFMDFRAVEKAKLQDIKDRSNVTTVNLTILEVGIILSYLVVHRSDWCY